jgi:hypothetical protein
MEISQVYFHQLSENGVIEEVDSGDGVTYYAVDDDFVVLVAEGNPHAFMQQRLLSAEQKEGTGEVELFFTSEGGNRVSRTFSCCVLLELILMKNVTMKQLVLGDA